MTDNTHRSERLYWTTLGVRMGFTSEQTQRQEILAAIDRMTWTKTPTGPPYLDRPAVRAIVNAVFHRRDPRRSLVRVGVAQLASGGQLIGLEDGSGIRNYVLDLDSEAIYVLAEFSHPLTTRQHATDHTRIARDPHPRPTINRRRRPA
jgi:hypothetical protein